MLIAAPARSSGRVPCPSAPDRLCPSGPGVRPLWVGGGPAPPARNPTLATGGQRASTGDCARPRTEAPFLREVGPSAGCAGRFQR